MKLIIKDYFISLFIALAICLIAGIFYFFTEQYKIANYHTAIESFIDLSENIKESSDAHRFLGEYKFNTSLSKIDSTKILPDNVLWVEKNSLLYYQINEKGEKIHISDTLQNDFIVHIGKMLDDISSEPKTIGTLRTHCAVWKDGSNQEIVGRSCTGWIHSINRCPDTLSVELSGQELVYKGEIWIIKEN